MNSEQMSGHPLPIATPEEVGLSTPRLARLTETLKGEVARGKIPGAVALIARRGRVAYFENVGRRDPARDAPMRKDDIFRIYSMTKPIVSVAAMMLMEEGRFFLVDPVAKYLPELGNRKVAVERGGAVTLVPAEREITIQDLLRHTSGLTYEFTGAGAVQRMYAEANIASGSQTAADQVAALGRLPLMHQPGAHWEYSRSTDVLGRLIEVISGESLSAHLKRRIFEPLGMIDTGFHVPVPDLPRLAEAFASDPDAGVPVRLINVREKPSFESGGGGLVSTALDYARFLQMMTNGGSLDDVRLLSRATVEFMTADHLGPITSTSDLLPAGHGFGLGFAVRLHAGIAQLPGAAGQYFWGGLAGTTFWVDPAEDLFAVALIQGPGQREYFRNLFRGLVYGAIAD